MQDRATERPGRLLSARRALVSLAVGVVAGATSTSIRRVMLGHALLSYAFGTGILAVAINLLTNLSQ